MTIRQIAIRSLFNRYQREILSFVNTEWGKQWLADDFGLACFSPDGRYALSHSLNDTMRLWDIESGKKVFVVSWTFTS
jgi:WD40 repeat protein